MSKQVDERVVEMRFDNKQFESGVSTSMSTLDKLKQKLNLSNSAKGLDDIGRAAKNVDMSGLARGVETVHAKFSALQVMGVTALANITNSAVNCGKRMASALTIDPIKTGFQEYETKMNSVQTIMSNTASKGTTMADVTKTLDELNTYADKTIYNFQEMTRNIGTFTAAGIGLKDSASSIKGIANLAAASGSSSQQASVAMYQLSQALAAGTVKLMDWNSVVNAGMGGEKFQNALKATAREHGVAVDAIIEKNGSFRESLQAGWISADILNETLNKFTVDGAKNYAQAMMESGKWTKEQADALIKEAQSMEDAATKVKTFTQLWDTMKEAAQSGWGQTWELIIGDFEKAKERMTELSDMFGKALGDSADSRNNFLGGALSSSWDAITRQVSKAGIETDKFQAKVTELAKKGGVDLVALTEECGSFEKALSYAFSNRHLDKSVLKEAIKSFTGDIGEATTATGDSAVKMEQYGEIVDKVINGDFGSGKERIDALTKAGYDYATIQDLVNEKLGSGVRHLSSLSEEQIENADSLSKMSDEQLKSEGYTEDQITALKELKKAADDSGSSINELIDNFGRPSGAQLIWQSLINILKSMGKAIGAVKTAWSEIFGVANSDQLYELISNFSKLVVKFRLTDEGAANITRTFKGLFAILDIVTTIVGGGLKLAFKAVSKVLGAFDMDVLEFTGNIGDALVNFRDWVFENNAVAKSIDGMIEKIPGAIALVKQWVDSFMAMPEVQAAIEGIKNKFGEMVEIGKNIIDGLLNGLRDGLTSVPDMLRDIGLNLLKAIKAILGIQSPSTEMETVGENVIAGLWNGLKEKAGKIVKFLKDLGKKMIQTFSDMDWSKLVAGGISVAMVLIVKKLADTFGALASPLNGLGDMFSGVGNVLDKSAKGVGKVLKSFSKVLNSFAFSVKAKAMKNIAISLAILTGALIALTFVDIGKLWNAVAVVAVMAVVLGGLMLVLDKVNAFNSIADGINFAAMSAALVGIGASMLLMGITVKLIGSLNPDQAIQGFIGLGALVVAIGGVAAIYGTAVDAKQGKVIDKFGKMLTKMSISLLLMVGVVKLISLLSADDLKKGAVFMAGFTVFVLALAGAAKIVKNGMPDIDKLGKMMVKISISMALMVGVIKLISLLSAEELIKGAVAMAAFSVFVAALVGITRFAGKGEIAKVGRILLAMSTSMLLLAAITKILASVSWEGLGKAALGIGGFTAVILALVAMMKFIGPEAPKIAASLVAMSVAIGILAGVAVVLSLISIDGLKKGITAVGLLGGVMTAMIWATRGTEDVKGNLTAMAVAIGVMAASVAALSMIDGTKLAGATAALAILMGMFAVIAKASGTMGKVMAPLIVMTVAVGVLAGVVYLLAKMEVGSAMGAVISLSGLLLAMSAAMMIINKAGVISPKALIALGVMTLVVGGLAAIIGLLAKCQVGSTLEIAASLSLLLLSLSGACVILSVAGKAGPAAFIGVGALVVLIAALGGLMIGIGALAKHFPGMEELLDKGIPILEKICYGLGSLIGNAIGGLSEGITSGLPGIGDNLSGFMWNLRTFIIGARTIDEKAVSGISSLVKMLALLSGANIIEGISKKITDSSSMDTFSTGLDAFADAIVSFSDKVKGKIDEKSVTAAANAGLMFAKMQTMISGTGGFIKRIVGTKDLGAFGTQLTAFGDAIVSFSTAVSGKIDEESVTAAANAGEVMATLQSKVQFSGGFVKRFVGEKNLGTFGSQLVVFGTAIVDFSKAVSAEGAINNDAVTAASNAGSIMAELQGKLSKTGGFIKRFAGEKNMAEFGLQLVAFGNSIVDFSKAVSAEGAINNEAIAAAANAGTLMTELQSKVVPSGKVIDFFTGKTGLDVFGTQITAFGAAIVGFSEKVKGNIDEESITAAANAGEVMASLQKSIPEKKWFDGKVSLEDFGRDMSMFGSYIATYSEKVSKIDADAMSKSVTQANRLMALIKHLAEIDASGIENFKAKAIGKEMKDYASQVAKIDASVVASSVTSAGKLITLVNRTASIDASGVANFKVDSIGKSMKSYSDSVAGINPGIVSSSILAIQRLIGLIDSMSGLDTSGVSSFQSAIRNLSNISLDGIVKSFSGATSKLSLVGASLIDALILGMRSRQAALIIAVTSLVTSMPPVIKNKNSLFTAAGVGLVTSMVNGVNSQKSKLSLSLSSTVQSAATNIKTQYSTFSGAGSYLAEGFANGIELKAYLSERSARAMAKAAAKAIEDALKINSPSKVTEQDGIWVGEGFSNGIEASTETVVNASTELGKASSDAIAESIAAGGEDIISAQNEVGDGLVESVKDTQEEVEAVKKRNIDAENAYWANLLQVRQNGVDAAEYKTMDMAKFEEDTLAKTTEIWNSYLDETQSKADSIMNARSLFDKVSEEEEPVTKEDLTTNLADQLREYQNFSDVVSSLNERMDDSGLKDFINTLSVDSLAELQAINDMTDFELSAYAAMYDEKYALATKSALTQLDNLKTETETRLSTLFGGVKVDASSFASSFDGSMDSIKQYVQTSIEQSEAMLQSVGMNVAEGVSKGMVDALPVIGNAADGMINSALEAAKKAADIHSPSGLFEKEIGTRLTEGVAVGMTKMLTDVANVINGMIDSTIERFKESYERFVEIGEYVAEGFREGILSKASDIADAAAELAQEAMDAVREELDEHSPSKKLFKLGAFGGEGFANGLRSYGNTSYKAGAGIADSARKGLSYALDKMYDLVNGDMTMQPTIRPVLDFSSVESGVSAINGLFNGRRDIGVTGNLNAINAMSTSTEHLGMYDVVSAIDKLRKDLGGMESSTYTIGGITYDDGSNVSDAIKSLVRAARVERRT